MYLRLLFITCCFTAMLQAQVTDLEKLSSGKFYASDMIKDNNNNIKGYFLVFESDKLAKETYELYYAILDENLKKVTGGTMTEMKFESWFREAKYINIHVKSLYKNNLLIEMSDQMKTEKAFRRYRILDLATNKMSDPFLYADGKMELHPEIDRKSKNHEKNDSETMFFTENGLVVQTNTSTKKNGLKKYLAHFTDDFVEDWRYDYQDNNDNPKLKSDLYPLKSDKEVMAFWTENRKGGFFYESDYSILLLDAKMGKLRKKFDVSCSASEMYQVVDCKITADKVYVMAMHGINMMNIGIVRFVFDKMNGNLIEEKQLDWTDMRTKLPIDGKGYIEKEGYLYIHNMLMTGDGKIIAVAEAFMYASVSTGNMYFLTIGQDFKLEDVFTVEKFNNKFPGTMASTAVIKAEGGFDFIDYQDLGDDEFLFFLHDNESDSVSRDKSTLCSIVAYSGCKFSKQTVNLKKEGVKTHIMNAKKGYLVFVEDFDEKGKPSEFRLEKINY